MFDNFTSSLQPKEQKEFMKFLSQKLAMEVIHRPETSASEFFNSVIETFPKKVKRGPRIPKTEEQTENARSHKRKDGKQEHLTDFQIFKNAQLELRADEFKGLSPKTKNQMLTHEWYALTDDQKQEVLKNNGHLSYFL